VDSKTLVPFSFVLFYFILFFYYSPNLELG
jgi:hypothetical protein